MRQRLRCRGRRRRPFALTGAAIRGYAEIVSVCVARYLPSRHYLFAGIVALVLSAASASVGLRWTLAFLPAFLFLLSAGVVLFIALQPPIEIHQNHLRVKRRVVPWNQIRRLDRTGWVSPLVVYVTLLDDERILLIYAGDLDSATNLLRHLRCYSREALIDGIPFGQFWDDALKAEPESRLLPSPKYRLLLPEDEAEVERMFQRLKTVGHIDPKKSSDET